MVLRMFCSFGASGLWDISGCMSFFFYMYFSWRDHHQAVYWCSQSVFPELPCSSRYHYGKSSSWLKIDNRSVFCTTNQVFSVLFNFKDKIYNIQSVQQEKAEERIKEQFDMENMIFTQDAIYMKSLSEISNETFSEDQLPIFHIKSNYGEMLKAYYEVLWALLCLQ